MVTNRLVDELFKGVANKDTKSLTITLSSKEYENLQLVAEASSLSKTKIIKLALEREGIFDEEKIKEIKKLKKGVHDDVND